MGVRALAVVITVVLALGVAHAQDQSFQKMIGTWKGKVELLDENERTLVIRSVASAGGRWIASVEYGPTGEKLGAFEGLVEQQGGTSTLSFPISTTRKIELSLVSNTELRGLLKVSDGQGSWVGRKMRLQKTLDKP